MLKIGKKNINLIAVEIESKLPDIVTEPLPIVQLPPIPDNVTNATDTEYQDDKLNLLIECVTSYIPELEDYFGESAKCFFAREELDADFNPLKNHLIKLGYDVKSIPRNAITKELNKLWDKYVPRPHERNQKKLNNFLKMPIVQEFFNRHKLDIEKIQIEIYKDGRKALKLKFRKIKVTLLMFFAFADLFKVFGDNLRWIWTEEAKLTQFRTIKVLGKVRQSLMVNGEILDFDYSLFDPRYVFPPIPSGLDNQCKVFGVDGSKVDMGSEIKAIGGEDKPHQYWIEHIHEVGEKYPTVLKNYAINDPVITYKLYKRLQELFKQIFEILEIPHTPDICESIAETCGKNIQTIFKHLNLFHFSSLNDGIEPEIAEKKLEELLKLSGLRNLSKLQHNEYGVLPGETVGGLLQSRTAPYPLIKGLLMDLDEKSCYATALCNMNIYLGEPIHQTFHNSDNAPTLGQAWNAIKNLGVPKDAYLIMASGKLKKAINTLVLSNLKFNPETCITSDYKRYAFPEDLDLEQEYINLINSEKSSEPSSTSVIDTKEIIAGKFGEATFTALSDLPEDWFEEFLNLKVDAVIFYHPNLMCDSFSEYFEKVKLLSKSPIKITLNEQTALSTKEVQVYANNVCLRFPAWKYYQNIKKLRGKYKEDKNPIQEIFKLILNSTYGVLASPVMGINNVIAANYITACARAACWRMIVSLNGTQAITDGTALKTETIPFGQTLREILAKNPKYLIEYEPNFSHNELNDWTPKKAGDFNTIYKEHLKKFLGKTDWLIDMYDYDLKDEKTDTGEENFIFNELLNTNGANYIKQGFGTKKMKARSYRSNEFLIKWYNDICNDKYDRHLIIVDENVVKLADGSEDALRILKDAEKVSNQGKRNVIKMTSELAEEITSYGILHPMGWSKKEIKLMKLISTSQFLPPTKEVRKDLDRFLLRCSTISKELLDGKFWKNLQESHLKEVEAYFKQERINITMRSDLNYEAFNDKYPCGLGFELICWGSTRTFTEVRQVIQKYVLDKTFNVGIKVNNLQQHIDFSDKILPKLKDNRQLKLFLAASQIIKLNAEMEYREKLSRSVQDNPTGRKVTFSDITTIKLENVKM
ncbi:hypothetical protein F7734_48970 [Scytonema sp. UIC 10036]|uniref:hypothetical protein n=1 Tax=Scytonema sp. UIC 10036 TaxID=2304196 RepID=UPI0012DACB7C|nr:hypothetical protein [Scytonema sp. UIC 10036]MUG99791.1 hypothetical protein [Scytonema sp. UIC 10036]